MGAKLFGLSRQKSVNYLIVLFRQETGEIVAFVDGNSVTAFRTAATSAVAASRLMRPGVQKVAVIGSGAEARSHLRALSSVLKLTEFRVFSPRQASRDRFAGEMAKELGIYGVSADTPSLAVQGSDAVIAAARSHDETPTVRGRWLRPGMTVISIGSTMPEQREIDEQCISSCDLIVSDMVEEVAEETGDMLAAQRAGIDFRPKMISLNDLVRGVCQERVDEARLPMFKSVGSAVQDVTIATLAFERALEAGTAKPLPIEFELKYA